MPCDTYVSCGISSRFQLLSPSERQVPHALLTRPPLSSASIGRILFPQILVRLACVKHAASVRPEPGSNSLLNDIYHLKSVKSLFAQHAIACVLCELLCLELFNVFFQHENRFRYKFFDIVQFSRSCAPQPTGWQLNYFITEVIFCQALFWSVSNVLNLDRFRFLRTDWNLPASIGSFLSLLSWGFRSHSFVSALGAQV